MSMPPTAMRLMRWQSSHRVMADSILAAVVLILNVLLGLGPVLTANTPHRLLVAHHHHGDSPVYGGTVRATHVSGCRVGSCRPHPNGA